MTHHPDPNPPDDDHVWVCETYGRISQQHGNACTAHHSDLTTDVNDPHDDCHWETWHQALKTIGATK